MISAASDQGWRMGLAAAILLAVFLAICASGFLVDGLTGMEADSCGNAQLVKVDESDESDDPARILFEKAQGFSGYSYGLVPSLFDEEILDVRGLPCSSVACADETVGFVMEGSKGEAVSKVDEALRAKGWRCVNGDLAKEGATYVKDGGKATWLFATASEIAGSVSVCIAFKEKEKGAS